MKFKLLLSLLLLTASIVAFPQEKQSRKSKKHDSAIAEKGLVKVSVMYPFAEGKTFNMEYYETKHMPMVAGFLGSNLVKYTIEKGVASGIPNQPLPYIAIGIFYVKSLEDYQAAIARIEAMSTHYLSELLRNLTGMSTQQHIHAHVIDKAKSLLKSTDLSINEIAYKLGFEYPQYFNRLFKSKTGHTPVEFRNLN